MRLRIGWLLAAVLSATAATARAGPPASAPGPVPVRVGEHVGFGRMVFDFAQPASWKVSRQGEQVSLQFDPVEAIGHPPRLPRNVRAVTEGDGRMEIVVAPGAQLRTMRLGTRLVLDVLDPPHGGLRPIPDAVTQAPPLDRHDSQPIISVPVPSEPPRAAVAVAAVVQPGPVPAAAQPDPPSNPVQPIEPADPIALAVARATAPDGAVGAILVPFGPRVGAAVVPRGRATLLVFDEPRPLDLSALQSDAIFGGATVHLLPAATLIRLPLAPAAGVALRHVPEGWLVAVMPREPTLVGITAQPDQQRLKLVVADPGQAVSVSDPDSGEPLLVGTQRSVGQAVTVRRRAPEFVLLPTWQGVAVEPLSDQLALRVDKQGFVLSAAGAPVALASLSETTEALAGAAGLTRSFELPALPTEALARRLRKQIATASSAPPLSRGGLQRAVAATMIALGMGVEAQAVLRIAAEENPREAARADHAGLAGIAALVASRPEQAGGIDDPRLPGSDEVALWRAVRDAELGSALPRAAASFASTWPLILSYQPELQERLLPLAAETLIEGGQTKAAQAVIGAHPTDPALALARGMLAQADGKTDAALAIYDSVANGNDRLARARAAPRAVELRLAAGRIDAAQGADALDRLLLAWRGDDRELRLRERLAELRARIGQGRVALDLLRDTAAMFPDRRPEIRARMKRVFADVMADPRTQNLSPLDFVALVDENADLLAAGPDGEALQSRLADRLAALDLPVEATPLLEKLMQAAPTGAGRAAFGARLAALRLAQGDAPGALAALSASTASDLPPALTEERTLTWAAATARTGNTGAAVDALNTLGTPSADEARATIFEQARNWTAAEGAWQDYARKTVPETGKLDAAQQSTLLRLATAAERAGDNAALDTLRSNDDGRMGTGPVADMFRLLTAKPIAGVSDLRRSGQEAALARALPTDLKSIR